MSETLTKRLAAAEARQKKEEEAAAAAEQEREAEQREADARSAVAQTLADARDWLSRVDDWLLAWDRWTRARVEEVNAAAVDPLRGERGRIVSAISREEGEALVKIVGTVEKLIARLAKAGESETVWTADLHKAKLDPVTALLAPLTLPDDAEAVRGRRAEEDRRVDVVIAEQRAATERAHAEAEAARIAREEEDRRKAHDAEMQSQADAMAPYMERAISKLRATRAAAKRKAS